MSSLLNLIARPTTGQKSFGQSFMQGQDNAIANKLAMQRMVVAQAQEKRLQQQQDAFNYKFEQEKKLDTLKENVFMLESSIGATPQEEKSYIDQIRKTSTSPMMNTHLDRIMGISDPFLRNNAKKKFIERFDQYGLVESMTEAEKERYSAKTAEAAANARYKNVDSLDKEQELSLQYALAENYHKNMGLSVLQSRQLARDQIKNTLSNAEKNARAAGLIPGTAQYAQFIKDYSMKPQNVNNINLDSLEKTLGQELGKKVFEHVGNADGAEQALAAIREQEALLNDGMFVGIAAKPKMIASKALQEIGINLGTKQTSNAEAYASSTGKLVAQVIKDFGSGTGLSDADRVYAERIAAGDITMTEGAIRRLIEINKVANYRKLYVANQWMSRVPNPEKFGLVQYNLPKDYSPLQTGAGSYQALYDAGFDEKGNKLDKTPSPQPTTRATQGTKPRRLRVDPQGGYQ